MDGMLLEVFIICRNILGTPIVDSTSDLHPQKPVGPTDRHGPIVVEIQTKPEVPRTRGRADPRTKYH